jgi:Tol biopolymer transport system component
MLKNNENNKLQHKRVLLSARNRRLGVIAITLLLVLPALFIHLRVAKAYYSIDLPLPRVNNELMEKMYFCVLNRQIGGQDFDDFDNYLTDLNEQDITIENLYKHYFAQADEEAFPNGLDQTTFLDRAYRCMNFHDPDQSNFEEWEGLFEYYTHEQVLGFFQSDYGFTSIIKPTLLAMGPLQIVFETERDGNSEIYSANYYDGTNQTRLTNDSSGDKRPRLSPNRGKIVFDSNRDGDYEIYTMPWDGGTPTKLTNNSTYNDQDGDWSSDGTKIVFVSNRDGNNEIYVMDSDGTDQTRLTNNSGNDQNPVCSPDGTKIYFETDRDGNKEIYVMDSDGTDQTNLTSNSAADEDPDSVRDAERIVFRSKRDQSTGEIYTMDLDGTNIERITNNTDEDASPNFEFYGWLIIFDSSRDHAAHELYSMNPDGSNVIRLTSNSAVDQRADW